MKRAWITIAALALIALPAMGQVRGAPASVTSMAPWRSSNPGPPASVTSIGPRGYPTNCSAGGISPLIPSALGCTPTQFTTGYYFPDPRDRGRVNLHPRRQNQGGSYYPVYVPYAYPVAVAAEPDADEETEPDDPPAPTIFEHRTTTERMSADNSRYGTHYLDAREKRKPAPEPEVFDNRVMPSTTPASEQFPVVLIFRDGHQQEVRNYAIVGQTLYDLGTFVAHKIPLAELNLGATIKANDDRGVEFSVPVSVKID
ncbi:MAG: hypothetical protein LAO06_09540 [Acidobacteriia bacterium]|nr:hypothetical protein [Terriglobia bacterium]